MVLSRASLFRGGVVPVRACLLTAGLADGAGVAAATWTVGGGGSSLLQASLASAKHAVATHRTQCISLQVAKTVPDRIGQYSREAPAAWFPRVALSGRCGLPGNTRSAPHRTAAFVHRSRSVFRFSTFDDLLTGGALACPRMHAHARMLGTGGRVARSDAGSALPRILISCVESSRSDRRPL